MKRYKIIHETVYTFAAQVTLDPHSLMLRPRESHELRIESSILRIIPSATIRWVRDVEDNSIAIAAFSEPTDQLEIYSEVDIQQYNVEPLDFVVEECAVRYPFEYPEENRAFLKPYRLLSKDSVGKHFAKWIKKIDKRDGSVQTFEFLDQLMRRIHTEFDYRVREEEGVQTPEQTLELGTGSCRDFANLFIGTARRCGFAARFVSGYLNTGSSCEIPGATHAWAEIYIPGAGWKGFDPTSGCLAGANHVTVAVSHNPEAVPPVAGGYVGPPNANLRVGVWVKSLDEPVAPSVPEAVQAGQVTQTAAAIQSETAEVIQSKEAIQPGTFVQPKEAIQSENVTQPKEVFQPENTTQPKDATQAICVTQA